MNYNEEYIKTITNRVAEIIGNICYSRGYKIVITQELNSIPIINYEVEELIPTCTNRDESEEEE